MICTSRCRTISRHIQQSRPRQGRTTWPGPATAVGAPSGGAARRGARARTSSVSGSCGHLVAEAHQTGIVSDTELVGIASEVWMLNTLFITELATAYRDALIEQLLCQDQERSALVEACSRGGSPTRLRCGRRRSTGLPYQGVFVVVARRSRGGRHALPRVQSRLPGASEWGGLAAAAEFQVGIVSLRSQRNTPALVEILRCGAVARVGVSPVYTGLERRLRRCISPGSALASHRRATRW